MKIDIKNYNPEQFVPVKQGDYPFTVINATEGKSQKGNPMISLELQIVVPGREKPLKIYDYLVETKTTRFVIDQFCKSTGLSEKFQSGELNASMCIGKTGWVHIVPDKKNAGSGFIDVGWYITDRNRLSQLVTASPKPPAASAVNDEIPF